MERARLKTLQQFVRNLPDAETTVFDMGTWGYKEVYEIEREEPAGLSPEEVASCSGVVSKTCSVKFECKTAACLLGWAAQIPALNRKGLSVKWLDDGGESNIYSAVFALNGRRVEIPLKAGQRFFGLTQNQAEYLFSGNGPHTTPQEAADSIQQVLDGEIE